MAFIFGFPLVYNPILSLFDATLLRPAWHWVGLGNYASVLGSPDFWNAGGTTVIWTVGSVAFQFLLGLALALVLHERFPARAIFRSILIIPWVTPGIIIAILFTWLYDPQFGLLNFYLYQIGVIRQFIPWLGDTNTALLAVIVANVWQGFPFHMIMLLSGLQGIPDELHEAAAIDGASYGQRTVRITVPMLKPVILTVLLLATIWTTNYFALIYGMTSGGPAKATTTLSILIFRRVFVYLQFGQAAAIAMLVFVLMSIPALIYIRTTRTSLLES